MLIEKSLGVCSSPYRNLRSLQTHGPFVGMSMPIGTAIYSFPSTSEFRDAVTNSAPREFFGLEDTS